MDKRIHYTHCPVCRSVSIKDALHAKDFTVSGEVFAIVECTECSFRFTQDVPDAASIGPYYKSEEYISHTNTKKGLINSLYHSVRKRTIRNKRRMIEEETGLGRGELLDVGSGTGVFVDEMKQHGWKARGLEPDEAARTNAKQEYGVDLEDTSHFYQLPSSSFDAITLWHVLEHVHELEAYVKHLKELLTENGKLFIAVPNYTSYDAHVYSSHWAAYDVPRHLYHFSPRAMSTLMERHGLRVLKCRPMWYDSFYVSLLSSKYKNGKTRWAGAFFNGLVSNIRAVGNAGRCSSVIYIISK